MAFKEGNTFGSKSKRGQAKITTDVKDKLMEFHDDALKGLKAGVKKGDFNYIKLWYDLMVPKMRSVELDADVKGSRSMFDHYTDDELKEKLDELLKI